MQTNPPIGTLLELHSSHLDPSWVINKIRLFLEVFCWKSLLLMISGPIKTICWLLIPFHSHLLIWAKKVLIIFWFESWNYYFASFQFYEFWSKWEEIRGICRKTINQNLDCLNCLIIPLLIIARQTIHYLLDILSPFSRGFYVIFDELLTADLPPLTVFFSMTRQTIGHSCQVFCCRGVN